MVTRKAVRNSLLGRDVGVAFAALVALYMVRLVGFQPLQIPAYLLIVAYDFLEVLVPVLTPYHTIGFPLFLYVLAVVATGATRWLRSGNGEAPAWTQVAGGVCLVVGTLSLLFGALVGGPLLFSGDNPAPLAITGATGIILLLGAWWLLGRRSAPQPARA